MKADISRNYTPVILGLNEAKEQQVSLAENTFMSPKPAKLNFYPPVLAELTRKPFLSVFNCDSSGDALRAALFIILFNV